MRDAIESGGRGVALHNAAMRYVVIALLLFVSLPASAQTLDLTGFVSGRGVNADGPPSWAEGGFGRFGAGGSREQYFANAQVGLDWTPSRFFNVHVSGVARQEPEDFGGERAGVVEAFAEGRAIFGNDSLQLRAGQFFLPTSRENKGPLWTSPYTISFSALNSWIGEEFRPIGAELEYRHEFAGLNSITAAATAFQGNDSMGTLLGWRGWTMHNRLSAYDEVLPLPSQSSVRRLFPNQRADGTKPFGSDLDGRTGYAGRVRFTMPERAMIQFARVDNRGDRALHAGQYAWTTDFYLVSAEVGRTDGTIVAAEYANGDTGMGFRGAPWVQMDFDAAYLLVSHKRGRNRYSARYDLFGAEERDGSRAENNTEDGRAWTFAWLFDVTHALRAGVEFTQLTGSRVAMQQAGFDPSIDARAVTVELRYGF